MYRRPSSVSKVSRISRESLLPILNLNAFICPYFLHFRYWLTSVTWVWCLEPKQPISRHFPECAFRDKFRQILFLYWAGWQGAASVTFPGLNAEEKFTDLTILSFLQLSIISVIFHGHGQSGILQTPSNV